MPIFVGLLEFCPFFDSFESPPSQEAKPFALINCRVLIPMVLSDGLSFFVLTYQRKESLIAKRTLPIPLVLQEYLAMGQEPACL